MSILTKEEYSKGVTGSIVCPVCKEIGTIEHIGHPEEYGGADVLAIQAKCSECTSEWCDVYQLTSYSELQIKSKSVMNTGTMYYIHLERRSPGNPNEPLCIVTLHNKMQYKPENIGKYVAAIIGNGPMFLTPNNLLDAYGIDDEIRTLNKCIALFDTNKAAFTAISKKLKKYKYRSEMDELIEAYNPDGEIYKISVDKNKNICLILDTEIRREK